MGSPWRHLHVTCKGRRFYGKRDKEWYMNLVGRLEGFYRTVEVVFQGDYRKIDISFLWFGQ